MVLELGQDFLGAADDQPVVGPQLEAPKRTVGDPLQVQVQDILRVVLAPQLLEAVVLAAAAAPRRTAGRGTARAFVFALERLFVVDLAQVDVEQTRTLVVPPPPFSLSVSIRLIGSLLG